MALNADTLLDRIHLKNQAQRWRFIALAIALVAVLVLFGRVGGVDGKLQDDYIARFTVEDIIVDDVYRHEKLVEIAEDESIKALILRMDSPGGSTVGADQLYKDIREIAKNKPVVCTMRSMATSGGYLGAIGADYIVANPGTLTGSIGVILQTAEITKLAEKIGITPITVKSGPLKGSPTLLEKFGDEEQKLLQSLIKDFQTYFIGLVKERRSLTDEQVDVIDDGRVVSAQQAIQLNLIDEIGGEKEALAWLEKEHQIDTTLEVQNVEVDDEEEPLEKLLKDYTSGVLNLESFVLPKGLLSLWQPNL